MTPVMSAAKPASRSVRNGTKMTQADFLAEARKRFDDNPLDWAFYCPQCGDVATGADFREALAERPRERIGKPVSASDLLGQECIGRTLGALSGPQKQWKGRGCDWCAYGLICGPWTIEMPDGRNAYSFPLADAEQRAAS